DSSKHSSGSGRNHWKTVIVYRTDHQRSNATSIRESDAIRPDAHHEPFEPGNGQFNVLIAADGLRRSKVHRRQIYRVRQLVARTLNDCRLEVQGRVFDLRTPSIDMHIPAVHEQIDLAGRHLAFEKKITGRITNDT